MDKGKLIHPRDAWPTGEVEIAGVGKVKIRALTRGEALQVRALSHDPVLFDRKLCAFCLTDPVLTEDEVGEWQANTLPAEIERVTDAIFALSGLKDGAAKEAYKSAGSGD